MLDGTDFHRSLLLLNGENGLTGEKIFNKKSFFSHCFYLLLANSFPEVLISTTLQGNSSCGKA